MRSLLTAVNEINCRHVTSNCRNANGWVLICGLDKKPAEETRCKNCERKKVVSR